jgi:hypothetical protein
LAFELLIATAIGCVLLGVLLRLRSAQTSAGVQSEIADFISGFASPWTPCDTTSHWPGWKTGPAGPSPARFADHGRPDWCNGADPNCPFARPNRHPIPDDAAQTKLAGDMTSPASPVAIDGTLQAADRPRPAILRSADVLIYEPVGGGA